MDSNEENEYRNKLMVCAETVFDKMTVLEIRDKLLKLKRLKQTDLATAVALVGTCPDMCPELERYFRQETNQVSIFEMNDITGRPDEHRMVKEYRRSGADQEEPLAHELRPTAVLNRTMDYLCTNIMDSLDINSSCGEWYDFVWSRSRSIRKDITQQHLCDEEVVSLTEKCARFHIHCSATLCEQNVKNFDPKINEENLSNCLQSLKDLYYDLSLRDIHCPNESEFRSYEILLHLNESAVLRDVQNYRQSIRESEEVQMAIKAFMAFHSNNYIKFFELVHNSSYLMSCILHRYFITIRQKAFKILRKCYTSNPSSIQEYPSNALIISLGFEDSEELKSFCDQIGLQCCQEFVRLTRGQNHNNIIKAKRSIRLVESKRQVSVGEIVNGCPLPPNPYKSVEIHNSFSSDGKLKNEAFEAMDQKNKVLIVSESYDHLNPEDYNQRKKDIFTTSGDSEFQNYFNINTEMKSLSSKQLFGEIPQNYTPNQLNDSLEIFENMAEDLINDTISEEIVNICGARLNTFINEVLEQTICDIFSDILLNTCDQMVKEISINVIKEQIDLKEEEMKIVGHFSVNYLNDLIDLEIKSIANQLLLDLNEESNERRLILISNQLFSDFIDNIIEVIASDVICDERQKREQMISIIQQKRIKNLQTKYFLKWKDWFLRQKRLKYLKRSFPAAPKWTTNKSSLNTFSFNFSDFSFNDSFNKSIEKELSVNHLLNSFIDRVIRTTVSEYFETHLLTKSDISQYIRDQRIKRIQYKYFIKWKQFIAAKKYNFKRKGFPAAPNWAKTHSFKNTISDTFSHFNDNFEIPTKKLRQICDESNQIITTNNKIDSITNFKPLFENELTQSKALTQRLSQEMNFNSTLFLPNNSCIQTKQQFEDEEEENIQTIEVFESEVDKMNRLKRLLSEERDYFSLQNFVQYLNDNND